MVFGVCGTGDLEIRKVRTEFASAGFCKGVLGAFGFLQRMGSAVLLLSWLGGQWHVVLPSVGNLKGLIL